MGCLLIIMIIWQKLHTTFSVSLGQNYFTALLVPSIHQTYFRLFKITFCRDCAPNLSSVCSILIETAVGAYQADVNSKLDSNAGRNDQNDSGNGTELDAEETHQAKQLHHYHPQHHNLTQTHTAQTSVTADRTPVASFTCTDLPDY